MFDQTESSGGVTVTPGEGSTVIPNPSPNPYIKDETEVDFDENPYFKDGVEVEK